MDSILYLFATAVITANASFNAFTHAGTNPQTDPVEKFIHTEVEQLSAEAPDLNKNVLELGLTAYAKALSNGLVKRHVLTVIDYSLPSNKQRMWVFNLNSNHLLYNTYVAHGKNSGNNLAHHFSNANNSKESSLGTFITSGTYIGSKGYSLNLKGVEKNLNSNAFSRRVVVHGAWYVEPSFIAKSGRAGRSWGCPAIAKTLAKPIINTIKNGSVLFAYYPDKYFLNHSNFLHV